MTTYDGGRADDAAEQRRVLATAARSYLRETAPTFRRGAVGAVIRAHGGPAGTARALGSRPGRRGTPEYTAHRTLLRQLQRWSTEAQQRRTPSAESLATLRPLMGEPPVQHVRISVKAQFTYTPRRGSSAPPDNRPARWVQAPRALPLDEAFLRDPVGAWSRVAGMEELDWSDLQFVRIEAADE